MKKVIFSFLGFALFGFLSFGTYSPGSFHLANGRLTNDWTTTSTTVSNISPVNFLVNPREVWAYDMVLRAGSSSTAGIKFAVNFPSGAAVMCTVNGTAGAVTATTSSIITSAATLTTEVYVNFVSQAGIIYIYGSITNGANAGTFQLQGAKVTSGTMTVASNSTWNIRRIL